MIKSHWSDFLLIRELNCALKQDQSSRSLFSSPPSLSLYESSNFTINFPLSSIWIVCSAISNRAITRKTKTSSSWQSGSSNVSTWERWSRCSFNRVDPVNCLLLTWFCCLSFCRSDCHWNCWLKPPDDLQIAQTIDDDDEILQHDLHVSIAFHRWSERSTYPKFSTAKIQWWRTQCNQVQLCWETFHDTYKLASTHSSERSEQLEHIWIQSAIHIIIIICGVNAFARWRNS